jgi:hypothetical protein
MVLSPDVIFEVSPCPPPDARDDVVKLLQDAFFPPSLHISPASTQAVCSDNANLHPNGSVFTLGLWVEADGFTDAQLRDEVIPGAFGSEITKIGIADRTISSRSPANGFSFLQHHHHC